MAMIQLHTEEAEDRSRRNNIRIKGVPENLEGPALWEAVMIILNQILNNPADTLIELDRVHKVPTFRHPTQLGPRDIVCRVQMDRY